MSDATGIPLPVIEPKRRSRLANLFIRLVKEKPLGTASGIIILIWTLVAIFADVLTPYPPDEMHLADRLTGPSAQYLLGTDHIGRDFLSRLILGGASFHTDRSVHHRSEYCDQYPDRRRFRILWW